MVTGDLLAVPRILAEVASAHEMHRVRAVGRIMQMSSIGIRGRRT
jgi:hypothetical protein